MMHRQPLPPYPAEQEALEQFLLRQGYLRENELFQARKLQQKRQEPLLIVLQQMSILHPRDLHVIRSNFHEHHPSLAKMQAPEEPPVAHPIGRMAPTTPTQTSQQGQQICPQCQHEHLTPQRVCWKCRAYLLPPNPQDKFTGQILNGRFRLNGKLGAGGMGMIYHATDLELHQHMAAKILPNQISTNETVIQRFQREANVQLQLRHPHVINTLSYGVEEELGCYILMELLIGQDLKEYCSQRLALQPNELLTLFERICDAMAYTHQQGILHRDLKPANLYLSLNHESPLETVKVIDFGIAKLTNDKLTQLTATGTFLGTPTYMSPEQASGQQKIDARSDIYTLGIILFELLTGQPPFLGNNLAKLLMDQIFNPPPQLAQVRPNISFPHKLQTFLDNVLAKNPNQRPSTMHAFAEQLREALSSHPGEVWSPVHQTIPHSDEHHQRLYEESNRLLQQQESNSLPQGLAPIEIFQQLAMRLRAHESPEENTTDALLGALLGDDLPLPTHSPSYDPLPVDELPSLPEIPAYPLHSNPTTTPTSPLASPQRGIRSRYQTMRSAGDFQESAHTSATKQPIQKGRLLFLLFLLLAIGGGIAYTFLTPQTIEGPEPPSSPSPGARVATPTKRGPRPKRAPAPQARAATPPSKRARSSHKSPRHRKKRRSSRRKRR